MEAIATSGKRVGSPRDEREGAGLPTASPQAHGFDFLHGRWTVTHHKLRERLAGCAEWVTFSGSLEVAPILAGSGNFDRNLLADPDGGYEAHSLRLYNPGRDDWSIWWLSSRTPGVGEPVVGGFADAKGAFFGNELLRGAPILVRTTYEPLEADTAAWTQAFSPDEGASWEINWIMHFRRAVA